MKMLEKSFLRRGMLFLLVLILQLSIASAQTVKVTGVVTDGETGEPLPGVAIMIKGTTDGTITDIDGNYSISAQANATLVFSYIGFEDQEKAVGGKAQISVAMKSSSIGIDEVVAIGYGTQKKKEVAGAVVQVKSEDLQKISTSDLGSALQGSIAGVSVQASSGQPGANSNIQIRGVNSITGANAPLFVVDGIPQESDPQLSNSEIETVDVLKDAASCAIYGVRGSGGVILITTKKGKAGEMKISTNGYYGIQKITSGIELMNPEEYWYSWFTLQEHLKPTSTTDNVWTNMENSPNNFTNRTNIVDVIEQDNAKIQNYSVNVSGGKKDLTYNVVGSFYEQEGTLINTGYERFNVRANTSYKKGKWSVKTSLGFKVDEQQYATNNLLYEAYKYKPYQNPLDPDAVSFEDGSSAENNDSKQLGNVMAKLKQTDVRNGESFNGNLDLNFEVIKDLNITGRIGLNYGNNTRVKLKPLFEVYDNEGVLVINSQTRSELRNTSDRNVKKTFEGGINYTKKFGQHKLKFLAVASSEEFNMTKFYAEGKDLTSNAVPVLEQTTAERNVGSGTDINRTLIGMLGRIQYTYKGGRYNVSVSARRDGSSKFGEDYRWETFPSASASWNVADEPFWQGMSSIINGFKVRGSFGTVGNNSIPDYSYAATIASGYDYPYGYDASASLGLGQVQVQYANPDVHWETSQQTNFGVDLGLLDNRFTFTADFYNTDKKDLLFPLLVPGSGGADNFNKVYLNIGDMNNRGVELAASYRQHGKFSWNVGATYSKNVNEIKKMHNSNKISYFQNGWVTKNTEQITVITEGREAGAFYVYETDGIINTEEKLVEYQKINSGAKMGDLIYVDQNGDYDIDESDKIYGGSGTPEFEIGLNFGCDYKGLDFSMQWFGAFGQEVINGSKIYSYTNNYMHKDLLYQWSDANPMGVIPSNRGGSHENYRSYTDLFIEDGTFVRLRNVTLGYTIPKRLISKVGISKLRLYVAADNPLTLTKYTGYDPEVGGDGLATRGLDKGNYPISAQYRAGVQLNF